MQVGIVGLPLSGKTTVFKALTHGRGEKTGQSGSRMEPNVAVIKVPDKRIDALVQIFKPRKIVPADIQFIDVVGFQKSGGRGSGLESQALSHIAKVEALLHVVRAFEDEQAPHPDGSVDSLRDIEAMDLELAFWDLGIIEKRLERIASSMTKVRATERAAYETEAALLTRLKEGLEAGQPIRDLELTAEEEKLIRGFQFITAKPVLILLNVGEDQLAQLGRLTAEVESRLPHQHTKMMELSAKLEAELAELPEEEAGEFMEAMGLTERGADRVIKACYDLLGLISFFTGGEDEVRAWTIHRGETAVEAAGAVHTDIQRGFIRAEVVSYDDLIKAGSLAEARRQGKLRMEGKTYVIQDGDIAHYLFSI